MRKETRDVIFNRQGRAQSEIAFLNVQTFTLVSSRLTCDQLLLGLSHSLRIEVVLYRENVRAELILALECLIICVNDAGISHDIKGLD